MKTLDDYIHEFMRMDGFKHIVESHTDFNPPVSLTYAIERLTIVHLKLWNLENQVRDQSLSDEEIGVLKRKIDYLNGVVRPRLVSSIGEIFAKAVKEGNEELVREPNFKDYKAR